MNIEKLIEAAKEIDQLAKQQKAKSKAWHQLAADARKPDADKREIELRRQELDLGASVVTDYGTAIEKLRHALHAKVNV